MKLLSFICCELAIQDVRMNAMSLINISDEISSISFPVAVARLTAVALFEREASDPDSQQCKLLAHLNDQQLLDLDMAASFQGAARTRVLAEMQGIPLLAPGDLKFSVLAGEPQVEVGSWIIKVQIVGAPKVDLFSAASGPAGITPRSAT
jgi:hypothetical protein